MLAFCDELFDKAEYDTVATVATVGEDAANDDQGKDCGADGDPRYQRRGGARGRWGGGSERRRERARNLEEFRGGLRGMS